MPRHDYSFRPAPRWEGGYFVPPAPVPAPGRPDDWSLKETVDSIRAMARNPVEATTQISTEGNDPQGSLLGVSVTVATTPELIRHVFIDNVENYVMSRPRQAMLRPALKDGLLTAEGETWRTARRALAPVFVPRHTRTFAPVMRTTTEARMDEIFGVGDVEVDAALLNLSYAVLSETLFSGELESEVDQTLEDVALFLEALGTPHVLDLFYAPEWIPRPSKRKGLAAIKRLRHQVLRLAQARRARLKAGEDVPEDFLTLLLRTEDETGAKLSDAQIEDQLITFIGAGHETTSRALTWLVYLLSQDKAARAKLEAEIDGLDPNLPPEDWAAALPWTMACFEEGMRLYPPAPFLGREAVKDDYIGDVTVKARSALLVNLWALHRHNRHFVRPNRFDPTRFLPERRKDIPRFAYFPFGIGQRVCIGQRFAMQEAAVMMAVIFRRYRFEWIDAEPHPWPLMRITTRPQTPLRMHVVRR